MDLSPQSLQRKCSMSSSKRSHCVITQEILRLVIESLRVQYQDNYSYEYEMEINRFEAYEFTSDGSYMLCDM